MSKIYFRYIFFKILRPFLLIAFTLLALAWLTQSLRFVEWIVTRGLSISLFLQFSSLMLPSLLWLVLPISGMLAVVICYSSLRISSELNVFKASGLSPYKLASPTILFSFMVFLISIFLSLWALPKSYSQFKSMQYLIRDQYASLLLQPGIFASPARNITVYIAGKDKEGKFNNIIVHDNRDNSKPVTMYAKRAELVESNLGTVLKLNDGLQQEVNYLTGARYNLNFDSHSVALADFYQSNIRERYKGSKERFLSELFNPEEEVSEKKKRKFIGEAHFRILWPFLSFSICTIVLLPFLRGDYNRRGEAGRLTISIILVIFVILCCFILQQQIAKRVDIWWSMYVLFASAIIIPFYFLLKRK